MRKRHETITVKQKQILTTVRQRRKQDMIGKDGHYINESLTSRRTQSVCRVIRGRPCIGAIGHASIGELVEHPLVRVGL